MEEVELLFHTACCQIVQEMLGEENMLLWEQLRIQIRVMYLPSAFQEYVSKKCWVPSEFCSGSFGSIEGLAINRWFLSRCHLRSIASALEISREDIAEGQDAYSGFLTMAGRVSKIFLAEYVM